MDANVQALFDRLQELWIDIQTNHDKFKEKGNKAAAARARKSLGDFKKLVTEYRKASVEACK